MLVSLITFQLFCALEIDALIYRNENIRIGDFKKLHKGRALHNHAIKTMQVSSKTDCVLGCLGVEQCVSYNYQETSSTGNHICELNNSTSSLSRLEDFKARDGFSYGESVLQTSNKGFCASFSCKNNGICRLVDNVNECACQVTTTGDLCEQWTDDAENYTLIFPYKSTNDFISAVALNSTTQVSTLSICVWVSYIGTGWNTFFSYSTSSTATMLAIRCHETGKCEIIINSVPSEVYTAPLNDGSWHHVCFSWTNNQGLLKFYVDGAIRTSKKAIGSSLVIDGNGKLFLGQLQTSSTELSFNPSESFMGKMYGFNMWDAVKSPSEFLSLSKQCISGPGNLVDWRVFIVKESNGMVNKAKPSICAFNVSKTANIQSSNGEKYIKMSFTASLREVTVCFWARRQSASTSSAFCYYSDTLGHALRWTFHETTEHKVYAANVQTLVYSSPNYDDLWHHFCYTWDNTDGRLVVFIDGVVMTNISAVATGKTIEGSGTLVVGQRLTGSAAVSAASYWTGYLTDFNIWNITLSGHVITAMSKAAGRDLGNVLNWNDVIYGGEVMGSLSLTPTSDVTTKVTDSDFYLNFGSTGSVSNYVEFQNPIPSITEFLVCFWLWPTSSDGGVFAYSIPSLADEWVTYIYPNKAGFAINNQWTYTGTVTPYFTGGWSHFCWRWKNSDGTTEFYKDGQLMKSLTGYQTGHTIPGGGYFVLGHDLDRHEGGFQASEALTGKLSHLNVWDKFSLVSQSMEEMSRGASSFQGNVVPWMSLRNKIYGTVTVVESSSCTLPDFSTKELRYKWCTDNINPGSTCSVLYPLFGRTIANNGKVLRCYCKNYLVKNSVGHYIFNSANGAYYTRSQLRLIKNA